MATPSQPDSFQDRNRVLIVIGVVIFILIAIWVWYTSGGVGVWDFVKKVLIWSIVAIIAFLIVLAVFKILQKPKIDLVANDKRDIIEAALLSKPPMLKDLYVTGDKDHGEFRLGRIIGYCQLQSYKDLDILAGLTKTQIEEMGERGEIPSQYIIKEDVFVFKRMMFPFSVFEEPKVLRTFEDEHSQLIGDVKIYAVSIIFKFGYAWPNRGMLDITRIDIGVIREAWRGAIHEFLKDLVSINKRASGLDAVHQKDLENRKLLKIPSPLGETSERQN